jgi:serine/threonine-protein kinase PknG
LKVDTRDPAARVVAAAAGMPDRAQRLAMYERSTTQFSESVELPLRMAGEMIASGETDGARSHLRSARAHSRHDWRVAWYEGLAALTAGDPLAARTAFESVAGDLPGELAPKLALGRVAETLEDLPGAIRYYDLVSELDPLLTAAAFGLGRCQPRQGNRAGAAAAYGRVPAVSGRYPQALLAAARVLIEEALGPVGAGELRSAADIIAILRGVSAGIELHEVSAALLVAAAERAEAGTLGADGSTRLLGLPPESRRLREAAEAELRACAHLTTDPEARVRYVDAANRVRPRTLV